MTSVVSAGAADRIAARTLRNVLRAGSGTPARYCSTVLGAAEVFAAAGCDLISAALLSLLLVVYRGALDLFPRGIGCVNGHRAGFAIGRYLDLTGNRDLLAFLTLEG